MNEVDSGQWMVGSAKLQAVSREIYHLTFITQPANAGRSLLITQPVHAGRSLLITQPANAGRSLSSLFFLSAIFVRSGWIKQVGRRRQPGAVGGVAHVECA
jgi:hypothetical protein